MTYGRRFCSGNMSFQSIPSIKASSETSVAEVEDAIANRSEVIEDYPEGKYGPSCLILGFTYVGRPLHVHCSYANRPLIKIITLYEPDPNLWVDLRVRRLMRAL